MSSGVETTRDPDPEYFYMGKATYGDWAYMFQLREVREMLVLEVQVVLEDLDAHRNQSLVVLLAPGVREGPLLNLPLDPNMKKKNPN